MLYDDTNQLFKLASDFIHYSNAPLFLTGKAGSGKTTFLKYIKAHTAKQAAVVAPTGVAAINAGGVTIHSFFQLPFASFIPQSGQRLDGNFLDKHNLLGRIKMNKERRDVLRQLELLIIDEISMVRCDVLDAIDAVLRHFRNRHKEPFGGVQVLLIGDMFQLPPVIKDDEWNVLAGFYQSPYFFSSRVIEEQFPVCIEFDKIYRQTEMKFIELLNKVRDNEMDEKSFALLNSLMQPAFQSSTNDNGIILTTHNYKADATNAEQLAKLKTATVTYKAVIEKDFYEKSFPAEEILQLKVGAQVMFIKNDPEKSKRYFNGKIGIVEKLDDETIFIKCKDEDHQIELHRETWENIRYTLNTSTQKLEEEVVGSFTQFPLRLAWAITIHKSQGLTFEKAVIDAGAAFAPGQVYVALSRCTTLNGIILKSTVTQNGLRNDERIVAFAKQKKTLPLLQDELLEGKKQYQNFILFSLFDFNELNVQFGKVMKIIEEHDTSFNAEVKDWLEALQQKINSIIETSAKFNAQLKYLLQNDILPEENTTLQERIKAASNYFLPFLQNIFEQLPHSPAFTDSRQNALAYNEELNELNILLAKKINALNSCKNAFSVDEYHLQKNQFTINTLTVNAYAAQRTAKTETPHPLLHQRLRQLRETICNETDLDLYMVAGTASITEMLTYLPQNEKELLLITGFGKVKVEKFGARFLDVICRYCNEYSLSSKMNEKVITKKEKKKTQTKAETKTDTKEETYKLYKQGKVVKEISDERKLTPQTIEGHLAFYVAQGMINIDELISKEKLMLIEPLAKTFKGGALTPLKSQLGENISYGEIRLTIAWLEFKKKNSE
jgi:hypothetical protein